MSIRIHITGLIAPLSLWLLSYLHTSSALGAVPKQRQPGYEINQYSAETDQAIVEIAPFGVKIDNHKGGSIVIATPPKWDVIVYSPKTKRMCRVKLKNFTSEYRIFFTIFVGPAFSEIPIVPTGASTIKNLKVNCYHSAPTFPLEQYKNLKARLIRSFAPREADYCTCSTLNSTAQAEFILQHLYGLPKAHGVPIHFSYVALDKSKAVALKTLNCQAKQYTADDFKVPPGLKVVDSVMAIRADAGSVKRATDFIDSVKIR